MINNQNITKEEFEKIQKEREEYVKNIKIEYSFGCYEEKKPESCYLLGQWYESIQKNFDKSFNLFKDTCLNEKHPRSCYKYANYRLSGVKEKPEKLGELIDYFKISCDGDLPPGCHYLGLIYWNGEDGRDSDPKLAVKYLDRACELEDSKSCVLLSHWYRSSEQDRKNESSDKPTKKGFVPMDPDKALAYAMKACEYGDAIGCKNVSLMYSGKDGFPIVDKNIAAEYDKKAKEIIKLEKQRFTQTGFTGQ